MSPFLLLAQVPAPSPELFLGLDLHQIELLGGGLLVLVVASAALALRARARRRTEAPPPATPELPAAPPVRPEIVPGPDEARAREEAAAARARAEAIARERRELQEKAGAEVEAVERARLEAEARELKKSEEEAKREEYRARKAAEAEARERRAREEAEARRLREEGEARARQAAAAEQIRATQEARARAEAEAGRTLAAGLERTRGEGFIARLNGLFSRGSAVDDSVLAQLEEILFTADIGVRTASELVDAARDGLRKRELGDVGRVKGLIRSEVERMVTLPRPASLEGGGPPHVTMVVGVNGSGKTTTIGKLAWKLTREGKKVVIAAGDTFRAAATEQLDVWAERAHATLVRGPDGSDPGAVVFDAVKRAVAEGADAVLVDTAGRLHTKTPLMEELKKVKRVIAKALPGAPHEVLLVLDATMGQNAIAQARQFQEAVGVTGIALTKLDGTAKGGVVIGISDELKIPVTWVGVGEKVADLRPFDPHEFVEALFEAA
ncbi:MAG TPA: signal recognition particle-docking protein FtsY [Myxococcaceae bacterium]|nr:signal recognition particle-docking protein FtsY [Myxococcaceae bacterium]